MQQDWGSSPRIVFEDAVAGIAAAEAAGCDVMVVAGGGHAASRSEGRS
jgi:beta-phosphoglucomutase-like phosphatase (HAD superfamily)